MGKKLLNMSSAREDLSVDLTLHNLPAVLLENFVLSVVKPYYLGNLSAALKDLMQQAVADQDFVETHIRDG